MKDLVSRQEAIDAFESLDWYSVRNGRLMQGATSSDDAVYKYADVFNTLRDLPAKPQWIPCSKKLPEKTGEYYVTWTAPALKGERAIEIVEFTAPEPKYDEDGYLIYPGEDEEGEWEPYDIHYKDVEILAWAPLLEPYEGE